MGEQRITRAERFLVRQSPRALIRVLASLVWGGELRSNVDRRRSSVGDLCGHVGNENGSSIHTKGRTWNLRRYRRKECAKKVARLRRKLVDMMLLILLEYNENKIEVVDRS